MRFFNLSKTNKLQLKTNKMTNAQIEEKIGKKSWIDTSNNLANKLVYLSGISSFDEVLDGKTFKEINAVIHFEIYPKGILVKIVKGFFGTKIYNFPILESEIEKIGIINNSSLVILLNTGSKIEFDIKKNDVSDVSEFLKENKLTELENKTSSTKAISYQENTKKHGVPTLISCIFPGVGQLIKGHIVKAILIWIISGLVGFFLWWTIILPFIVWAWNVFDAYNSNSDIFSANKAEKK